ncbi:MAG: DNA/RNA non-specific endonuclease [Gemmatimonadaceae bacterium]
MRISLSCRAALVACLSAVAVSCGGDRILKPAVARGGGVAPAGTPQLFITEVMPDPTKVADAAGEWFEIFNAGTDPVDLAGWKITSGPTGSEQHTIATSVVVPANGFAVLGNNADAATNGGVTEQYSYGTAITLNNSNTDWLTLKAPDGTLSDSVAYAVRTGGTPAPYTPPSGASRAVIDLAVDHTIVSGTNWKTSTETYGLGDRGTPGSGPYGPVVPAGPVVTVTVTPSPTSVAPGATKQLTAIGLDAQGRTSATTFTWTTSAPAIATVDANGLVTGVSDGGATITATSANNIAGAATITVAPAGGAASISISVNAPAQAPVGYTKPAFPTVRDADNKIISPPPTLVWTSSDANIATVDSLGYITGVAPGTVVIRATAPNGVFGSVTFTVNAADATTPAIYRNHLEFGTPTDATPADELILAKRQYVLSYNKNRGGPNWVSWDLNATQFGAAPRCDCFSADRQLPADVYRVVDFDYRNGGYDRGHMTQSESRTTTDQENAATFLLTNILPQAAENNQGPWSQFENYLNDLVRTGGKEVYVIAGGQFAAVPGTLKNEGRVAIPDYTWKIAVIVAAGRGLADIQSIADLQVIAVRMPNLITAGGPASAVGIRNTPWQTFLTTVKSIQDATGYDFLDKLPDDIERAVEGGDRPPVANIGGPYASIPEGSAAQFNGSASSDPDNDPLTYAWTFGDGSSGTGATPSHTYADNGTYTVTLTVSDPAGATSSATSTISVTNVAPMAHSFALATILRGESYTASTTFTDPGADTWTASVDYGDGTGAQATAVGSRAITLSHRYTAAGTFIVAVTITDDDGGSGSAAGLVRVLTPVEGVAALFQSVEQLAHDAKIQASTATALETRLHNAYNAVAAGDVGLARHELGVFISTVEGDQIASQIQAADATALVAYANRILGSI